MLKKILIVENNDDERDFMKILLELSDYDVIEAKNGREAIDEVRENQPDLILMDIAMPEMNGLTAVKAIKKIKESKEIPTIAVTSYDNYYHQIAMDSGYDEVIQKPVSFRKLDRVLKEYLVNKESIL